MVVPSTAVQVSQTGTFVFVVTDDNVAKVQPVKVERTVGGQSVIEQRAQGRRGRRHRRPIAAVERNARQHAPCQSRRQLIHEHLGTCIRRPVLTTLMTASLIVFGAFAYRLLPVAALPAVDFPTIQITATLPGASPGDDGGLGRFADRAAALHHRRHLVDDFVVLARHVADHRAVRPRPQHRRRRARRADRIGGRSSAACRSK